MAKTLAYQILEEHRMDGALAAGQEIGLRIDQTLTQDATGTTAYLLFEAMGTPRVKTELSVSYVDHNLSQFGPENHADHLYLASVAAAVGAYHSRPGNGICHQVHLAAGPSTPPARASSAWNFAGRLHPGWPARTSSCGCCPS
jgi:aconitate hydratase